MIDEVAIEVARDAVGDRRFDALPEIAEQSPSVLAALIIDLARAVDAMRSEGMLLEIELRRVPDVAALRETLIEAGAIPSGLYPNITNCESKNSSWQSATLAVGNAEIDLSSVFEPRSRAKKPRAEAVRP